jgi:hypothetical protein
LRYTFRGAITPLVLVLVLVLAQVQAPTSKGRQAG